jgi:D-alanyl-D-alanine dipeptidase
MTKDLAPQAWEGVEEKIAKNVLYYPIVCDEVKSIPIEENGEEMVDLLIINHPRIKLMSDFDKIFTNSYEGFSKIRKGVYERLQKMLDHLPKNIGIAYFEGYRPPKKQKEYFDKRYAEIIEVVKDPEIAFAQTCKEVSPIEGNVPTHCTGAAIDITLFINNGVKETLIDMGKFDVIYGDNDQKDTFASNISDEQKTNRLMLYKAAAEAGLASYGYEWWHYSYGDRVWAYINGKDKAIYNMFHF